MASNRPGEILALHGQQLVERLPARLLIARQNHRLHVRDAILGEEHVLGAAQPDAFGAELAGGLGVARNVGVGADAEVAAEFVGPLHQLAEVRGVGIGLIGHGLAEVDVGGGAVDGDPIALLHGDGLAVRPRR